MAIFRARAVFFDLDNTLFDHQSSARAGVTALLMGLGCPDEAGLQRTWAELEGQYFHQYLQGNLSFQDQRRARMRSFLRAAGLEASQDEGALDDWFTAYLVAARAAWTALPDVSETLQKLRNSGTSIAVVTNGSQSQQVEKMQAMGIAKLVDDVFTSEATGHAKPAAEAFLIPCAALGVAPAEALHVGDDPMADFEGAKRAGLQSVLLDRSSTVDGSALHTLADLHVQA